MTTPNITRLEINTWVTKSKDYLLAAYIPSARVLLDAIVKLYHAFDIALTYMPDKEKLPRSSVQSRYWIIEIGFTNIRARGGKVWGYEYDAASNSYKLYKYFSPNILVPVLQDIEDIVLYALEELKKNIESNCIIIPVLQFRKIDISCPTDRLYIYFDCREHILKISARPILFICY